jgi:hypothetical protein
MKTLRIIGIAAVAGALLVLGPVGSATAADTTTTFSLTSGSLSVTAPASASLSGAATGSATVSGSLGTISISDLRGGTTAWGLSAASTTFVGPGAGSTSTGVSFNTGASTGSTGTVTPTSTGATSIMTVAAVAAGTAVSGNNTVSFAPDLTVSLPGTALVGAYTGTVTTSVA